MARFNFCNLLHLAPDAKRLWQFEAKGGSLALTREQRVPHTEALPGKWVAKNWSSLWQPKLNIAWLPAESVFLRVVELPASNLAETLAMVELQLEKFSPFPVAQIVWTMHVIGSRTAPVKGEAGPEHLQTVVVVIAERKGVEEVLGKLERDGFLADRLETPMLDQLEAVDPKEDGAWLFPLSLGGQSAALVAWWYGGALRNLSFVTLPTAGERAKELQEQLSHLAWSGELEGWLTAPPKWHLMADPVKAVEWETVLRAAVNEPVAVTAPPPLAELAGRTARRAASAAQANLLPAEFTAQYRQQFVDRLWLRALAYAGLTYAVAVAIYFGAVGMLGYQTGRVESAVASLSGSYTNALQLKMRYSILQERSQLKYAALDCWQLVAQEIPEGITLQRSSFVDGKKLSLSGTAGSGDVQKIYDFYDALRKAKLSGQPMFAGGEQPQTRQQGMVLSWNFSLELLRSEAEAQ